RNTIYLVKSFAYWEFDPEIEVENEDKLYEIISDIKTNFPNLIKNIEIVKIIKDYKFVLMSKGAFDNL
ncbi:MAG: hypothetical protein V1824_00390, partial [archaeon]